MDLSLTPQQQTIKDAARRFFEAECPTTLVRAMESDERGYTSELWERMAALGWLGLPFPSEFGGSGGSLTDLAVLLEEFGRALVPGPFFNSVAIVGLTVLDAGTDAQRAEILPRIADGSLIATAALLERDARYGSTPSTRAERQNGGLRLYGDKIFVEYANSADTMLVPAILDDGVALTLVPARSDSVSLTQLDSIARDPQFAVNLDSAPASEVIGDAGATNRALDRALERAAILHCAQSVGAAQRVLEMTVEYTKQRVQFDRAIATFQSVQHDCADMVIAIDSARLATYEAITRIEDGEPASKEVALAKTLTNHAYKWTTLTAQQIHGGIGFMEEYDLQLWTRRAKVAELKYGASSGYVETFSQTMGLE